MPKIRYQKWNPRPSTLMMVEHAEAICEEYQAQGFNLTLRQLYYQFVARDLLGNSDRNYKRLGEIVNNARLAGLIDWGHLTDRTRNLSGLQYWGGPEEIVAATARNLLYDPWADQPDYVEVWVEKEALADVVARASNRWRVNWFSCRGYVSQSEMWTAGRRLQRRIAEGRHCTILHLGDHDPSGIDMTRDIAERLMMFSESIADVDVVRIALNMDQVVEYAPPPNPAKVTDSRFEAYMETYGPESWELDALDPTTLMELIGDNIESILDDGGNRAAWDAEEARTVDDRGHLEALSGIGWDVLKRATSLGDRLGELTAPGHERRLIDAALDWFDFDGSYRAADDLSSGEDGDFEVDYDEVLAIARQNVEGGAS